MSPVSVPPGGRVALGPFLTEQQFEQRVHATPGSIRTHPFLLRISGTLSLGPAYPAFQLDGDVVRSDIAWVVTLLKKRMCDLDACDWFVRHNYALGGMAPLDWLDRGLGLEEAARAVAE